jgi:catechol 2,3-dioxygenase-like lactoylglutathione lyase family enzyme
MQLAQVILFVHDTPRMLAFYARLGLTVVDGDAADGFVRLRDPSGGAVLALHYTKVIGPPSGTREDTALKACFHVDDVDASRAAMIADGVTMQEIHRWQGIAFCNGIDPEGNIFQITTR